MTSLDFLYIVLALCALGLVGALWLIVVEVVATLKVIRLVALEVRSLIQSMQEMKLHVGQHVASAFSLLLSPFMKKSK